MFGNSGSAGNGKLTKKINSYVQKRVSGKSVNVKLNVFQTPKPALVKVGD